MGKERTLAIVPSRGGSTELRRKNVLPVGSVPMFLRSAQAARDAGCQVVVSTDDPEIRSTAVVAGFDVHDRGSELAECVVDDVVKAAVEWWHSEFVHEMYRPQDFSVLLVQPTVQPITANILKQLIDTNSDKPRSFVQDDRHQLWQGDWLTDRVNRQEMVNPMWRELGIRWWPSVEQIGDETKPWVPYEVTHLVDIDTAADYHSVTIPKRIALWPIADQTHGMGHLRRCLAIAERLQHHHVVFVLDDCDDDAEDIIEARGWETEWSDRHYNIDLWILDRLSNDDMPHVDGSVVMFEDESSYQADLKIDALYTDGADWCVLRPEFLAGDYHVNPEPLYEPSLMLMFGGTDPSGLGERIHTLFPNHQMEWVKAGDDKPVAELMHQADILITSAGRTVFEAAAVGIPTIVLAQNLRETTHTHLGYAHGNIYLGLGRLVADKVIVDTVRFMGEDVTLRRELSERGRPDGKGLDRIIHAIEGLLGGL